MDDFLEKPSEIKSQTEIDAESAEQSSDEDDGGPDWTRLSGLSSTSSARPVIPKRGDKEFEPAGGVDGDRKGTSLQQHKLDRIRAAMFTALDVERTVSSKAASYAIWCPEISRARILTARGNFLATMGHNTFRDSRVTGARERTEKAVELLPEEALYLMERGSMFCWSRIDDEAANEGVPMSVQHAYAEMIGREGLTLERYLVYTYLKRLGYTVTRAHPPDPYYKVPPPITSRSERGGSLRILARIANVVVWPFKEFIGARCFSINWWRPLSFGFAHRFLTYPSLFSSLRFIRSGYTQPLHSIGPPEQCSPYEVFFHVYKPATPYRKTAPPPPDYSVVVVDARTTPMPTLHELCSLFEWLPELPPPTPRKRAAQAQQSSSMTNKGKEQTATNARSISLSMRLWNLLRWLLRLGGDPDVKSNFPPSRRPNPFQMLKTGKKMIVVAAIDSGMISFFRFCQGSFDEWPMA